MIDNHDVLVAEARLERWTSVGHEGALALWQEKRNRNHAFAYHVLLVAEV